MSPIEIAARVAPILGDAALKSVGVLGVAGVAALVLRGRSAAARHGVWLLALGALACLPLLCVFGPRWSSPVLPARVAREQGAGRMEVSRAAVAPTAALSSPSPQIAVQAAAAPVVRAAVSQRRVPWMAWAVAAWGAGVVVSLIQMLIGLLAARLRVLRCDAVSEGPMAEAAERARRAMGVGRRVEIRAGDVAVPVTFGALRPCVLLNAAAEWPGERLRVVLLHEMAHVRRWDWAAMTLARAVRAIYWFHPLAWLAAHRLRVESEGACDDLVLNSGVAAVDYAGHLLEIARELAGRRAAPGLVTMAHRAEVGERLRAILAAKRERGAVAGRKLALCAVVALGCVAALAGVRPTATIGQAAELGGSKGEAGIPPSIADRMKGSSRWDKTLADGIHIRLLSVGVMNAQDKVVASWTPEGGPTMPEPASLPSSDIPGSIWYKFDWGVIMPSIELLSGSCMSVGEVGERAGDIVSQPPWRTERATLVTNYEYFPKSQALAALQLSIATGPEKTIISAPPRTGAVRRLPSGEVVKISPANPHSKAIAHVDGHIEAGTAVTVTVPTRFVHDMSEYEFHVIGRDGKPFRTQHSGMSAPQVFGKTASLLYTFRTSELPLDRVKEFRFTYRPAHTVVFRNVALRPYYSSGVIPSPTPEPAIGFRRYISRPLPDGTRYTFLYPSYMHDVSRGSLDQSNEFITVHIDSAGTPPIPWTAVRGGKAISYRTYGKGGTSWPSSHEEFISVVVGRDDHAVPENIQWIGENGSHHSLAIVDVRTHMRFQLIHEDRYIPALFKQTDPVVAKSFRVLPPARR